MQIRDIIGTLIDRHRQALGQMVRFALVGVAATLLQYCVYLLLIRWMHPTLANTIAYVVSFLFNYVASVTFTFQVKSNMQRGAGFALAHVVNYTLQTLLLMLFLWLGVAKQWAMLPVFAICVPVNFVLVRYFLTRNTVKEQRGRTDIG